MNQSPRSPLITVDELSERIGRDPRPFVLDVRWTLAGGSDPAGYAAGHVPGARYLDLDRDLAGAAGPGGRHPLPDPADLQAALRRAGLSDGADVVVYDGGPGLAAARAWWLLRWSGLRAVRVLDGGYPAWTADDRRPVESGSPGPAGAGTLTVRAGAMPTVDADGAERAARSTDGLLLDARAAARYRGEVEPLDPVAGHIPGAVNLPITELMRDDGRYRPAEAIADVLAAAGVTAGIPVIASCGSGITACQIVLAAELIGVRATLYPGSYSQWCALGRPIATGS